MQSPQKRLISGVKPTGRVHVGNYFGAMKQFIDLQDEYEVFAFVPNLHALTENVLSREELIKNTEVALLDHLAAGLDPEKAVIFKQSDVTAHASLAWIFDCLVTVPYLMRAHAFKDAEAKGKEVSAGTFTYPALMAADILLYDVDIVPVGQDQKQHIEYARDISQKFNNRFGELFNQPKDHIIESVAIVPGTDGRKMSKSYGNTIPLFAADEEITKAVMSIPTDSRGKDEEKNPDDLILYQIHKLFNPSPELKASYAQGLGYGDAKKMLIADIISFVTPMRERRKVYEQNPILIEEILRNGALKANEIATKKLQAVYEAVGLSG